MNLDKALLLTPSHCYDEFPVHHEGEEADDLLSSWTALWHPAIVRQCEQAPSWEKVDEQHGGLEKLLFVVPSISQDDATSSFRSRAESDAAIVIDGQTYREPLVSAVLKRLGNDTPDVNDDFVRDFYALGYCFLQTELLTRNMRYSSNLNEGGFHGSLVSAANAAFEGDASGVHDGLQACFDMLAEEREHYYAVEVYLLDVAIGSGRRPSDFRDQLNAVHKTNLVVTADDIELLCKDDQLKSQLTEALQNSETTILGGEADELRTSLVSNEDLLQQLQKGIAIFERILDFKPRVFGRRRFGLSPTLPGILERLGYAGALHSTFDDGRFPEATQTKSRWEGTDGSGLSAIMRAPLDATQSKTFLNLAGSISESMDMDHVATRCLAHPAGHVSKWFDDLRRVTKYTNGLGRFVTAEEYFEESYDPGTHEQYPIGRYSSPFLRQSVAAKEPDPISSVIRYWKDTVQSHQTQSLEFLATMVGAETDVASSNSVSERCQQLLEALASKLVRGNTESTGLFMVNGLSFPSRQIIESPDNAYGSDKPVYASCHANGKHLTVADTPAMGFACVPRANAKPGKNEPSIVDEHKLRNEFLECEVDPKTGGLRNIRCYESRNNQLSQQLAVRMGRPASPQQEAPYATMIADEITTTASSPIIGEIVSRGRLIDEKQATMGTFEQTTRLNRGSRVLRIRVSVDMQYEFSDDAWNSYLCSRFAWPNEAADLVAGVMDRAMPTAAKRFEAPMFVDIDDASYRTTIMTGGLPYHRRVGARMLDTLLMVAGETAREFEFGIGIGLANPARDAADFLSVPTMTHGVPVSSTAQTGWLFHIDSKNVTATSWQAIRDAERHGFRVRVIETTGRPTQIHIKAFRNVTSARKVDFQDETLVDCPVNGDAITVNLDGHEWTEIEGLF